MCGIVGVLSAHPIETPNHLLMMRDAMIHRGPDDAGAWWSADNCVGLAQRRLAIIDLSPGGHQPMSDSSGRLTLTHNGEIYNYLELRSQLEALGHVFRSSSDTEVILEAYLEWGVDCLQHLRGMFAFALYDSSLRRLFIARDRAGEKPLFFWRRPGKLAFASELKALMADPTFPRTLDLNSLDYYLAYGYVPGEMCIFKEVRKLLPGHAMTYDLHTDELRSFCYWQLPEPTLENNLSVEDLTLELEGLLEDAVRGQLVADVPVGVLLSGGIDSSLVTAMAARTSSVPVKTFTISFPGYGTYDESPHAKLVAHYFGTEHTPLVAEPSTVDLLPDLARQYDEPMADSSMVPTYLVSRLVRQHAKVALGGDGGDELFGGYPHYSWLLRQERIRRYLPRPVRSSLGTAARLLPVGMRGRNHAIGFTSDLSSSIAHINLYFDYWTRRRLLAKELVNDESRNGAPEKYRGSLSSPEHSVVRQASMVDFLSTMANAYLVKVDRASMLSSLEVRAPFLDHRLIEFAFGRVPDSLRATESERKILPRRLAQRVLPPGLDLKRKQGFSMPLTSWFKGEWGRYVESVLREADPHLFNAKMIADLIAGQNRGYANTERLFALTIFELWRREYRVSLN